MSNHKCEPLEGDALEHLNDDCSAALARHTDLAGCFTILGPIQICYSQKGSGFKVCLKIAGIEITCVELGLDSCQTLTGNVLLAKVEAKICLEGNCLTYDAKACVRPLPWSAWECASASGNIICF